MILQRELDCIESTRLELNPVFAVQYEGVVNVSALSRALRVLAIQHPVLRGRICNDTAGPVLLVSENTYPKVVHRKGGWDDLREITTQPLNIEESVADLTVMQGDGDGYIALRVNHAIVDGGAYFFLLKDLWDLYGKQVEGRSTSVRSNKIPRPPSELYLERWNLRRQVSVDEQASRAPEKGADPEGVDLVKRRILFSQGDTARIIDSITNMIDTPRYGKLSLGSALCGALSVAVYAAFSPSKEMQITLSSTFNLRNLLAPPLAAMETTNFAGSGTVKILVDDYSDAISAGVRIRSEFDYEVQHKNLAIPGYRRREQSPFVSASEGWSIIVNNLGMIPKLPTVKGVRLLDLILATQEVRKGISNVFGSMIYTFEGQLNISFIHPVPDVGLVDVVVEKIHSFASLVDSVEIKMTSF